MSIEADTATWRAVKAFAEAEIEKARADLELPAPTDVSNLHRGRIRALRDVLALASVPPPIEVSTTLY